MQKSDPGYYVRRPPSPRVPNSLELIQDPVIQEMFREEAMKSLLPVFVTPEIQVFSISDLLYPNSWIKRLFLEGTTSMTPPSLEDTEEFGEQHAAKIEASGGGGGQVVGSIQFGHGIGPTPAPDVEYVATVVQSGRRAGIRPTKQHNLSFSTALVWLKAGHRLRRAGWNAVAMGRPVFVVMMPELNLPPYDSQEPGPKVNDRTAQHIGPDAPLHSQPYFAYYDKPIWNIGWVPSIMDILAEDWEFADIAPIASDETVAA